MTGIRARDWSGTVRWWGLAVIGISAVCSAACSTRERGRGEAAIDLWLAGDVHVETPDGERLAPLRASLHGALGIVNLEGPIGTGESSAQRLVNNAQALPILAAAGVRMAGIRNNHDRDLGPDGLAVTRTALRAAGIEPAGGDPATDADGADSPGSLDIAVVDVDGSSLAVTAHDLSPASERRSLGPLAPAIARTVADARARADIVVATFHVRGPPSYLPRRELIEAVDIALENGALVVAAHGSHALARVERRGDAVIAWGLGNLLFDCPCTRERDALIVRLSVRVSAGNDGRRATVASAQVIPVDAGLHGEPVRLAEDAPLTFELLRSLGTVFRREDATSAQF